MAPEMTPEAAAEPVTAAALALGVYVHWPFCLHKCPYCDFNSHVREGIDAARYAEALCREFDQAIATLPPARVSSIFFGGGTPSLMPAEAVERVIGHILGHLPPAPEVEVTLEANPTSSEAARFAAYREAGVNRLSLGVQALDDAALKALGRQHSAAEALEALALARDIFPRFSFDLIYARPGQSVAAWEAELGRALELAGEHLSLYQLTLEEGTPLAARHARGEFVVPGEDDALALFDATRRLTVAADLPAYEVSTHARPGAACRHNLDIWRGGFYIGIGPGAHGRLPGADGHTLATRRLRHPERWLAAVEAVGHGGEADEPLSPAERATELVMAGLRLSEGIDLDAVERRAGLAPGALLRIIDAEALGPLIEQGFVVCTDEGFAVGPRGLPLLNAVLARLLA